MKRLLKILILSTASMQLIAMEPQSKIKSLLTGVLSSAPEFFEALALLEKGQLSKEDFAYIRKENSIWEAIRFLKSEKVPAEDVVKSISLLAKNGADINSGFKKPGFGSGTPLEHLLNFQFFNFRSNVALDRTKIAKTLLDLDANPKDSNGKPLVEKVPSSPEYAELRQILIDAMLKLTKEQKNSVYALIASLKKNPSLQTSKDTRGLIAQALIDTYKKENLAKTRAEIEKIQNGELRNQLLQFLEGK